MANGLLIRGDVSVMHKSWYRLLRKEVARRRKARRKQQKDTGEEDDSGVIIPMELVEKILANVPFPDVFKGRVLSRSWRNRFSMASKRSRPIHCPFLNELSTAAVRWPTFCPVYMSPEGKLIGYNHSSLNWETIVISSYIPMRRIHSNLVVGRKIGFGGSLMWISERFMPVRGGGRSLFEVLVANIQTGSWKTILCPLEVETSYDPQVLLISEPGSEDYKLLVYDLERPVGGMGMVVGTELHTNLFDIARGDWMMQHSSYTGEASFVSSYCTCSHQVHVNGNVYFMGTYDSMIPGDLILHVMKYNLLENVWSESITSVQVNEREAYHVGGVFFCGEKLMLVTVGKDRHLDPFLVTDFDEIVDDRTECRTHPRHSRRHCLGYTFGACAYEVCQETLEIDLISASPVGIFKGICRSLISDDNHIYFFCSNCPGKSKVAIVRFNVSDGSWDRLPSPPTDICRNTSWATSAYVPGQNPFALA